MTAQSSRYSIPGEDELLFLPLGGSGEIGMNLTLYGHAGAWIAVDFGITFGGDDFPNHPVMMPDPAFLSARRERLAAIVLTHGHEDHIGALPYLWPRFRCPIYATPFTAALVRSKLARIGIADSPVIEIALGERFRVGPFDLEYVGMTHSIPEPNSLLINTPSGSVFHTGDWKLDERPVVGGTYDRRRLKSLREANLVAMVCDSTNAVVPGRTGSEGDLFQPLLELVRGARGRVLVTSFASNVARLVTLARVAQASDRRFGVLGRALERVLGIARMTDHWPDDLPNPVSEQHVGFLPRDEILVACTGSQGEPRSALARLATDSHRKLLLDEGDTVIFSSRLIPGNERSVERLQTRLRQRRIEIVTDRDALVHVSGHPAQDDLRRLYDWVRPSADIPVHGTPRHLDANAAIARANHVPRVRTFRNGDLCRLGVEGPEFLESVANGRLAVQKNGQLQPVPADQLSVMRSKVTGRPMQDQT